MTTLHFIKPENALRRAEELIAIDSKMEALNILHNVITMKKYKVWSATVEDLMKRHLLLCVELRKGKMAKEALHQYRSTFPLNLPSLENVIRVFLKEADKKATEAQSKSDKIVLEHLDDLEAEDAVDGPSLLTSISGEDRKERADRELVTPWLRFLWEALRIVLDILKNNKLETLYHETAQQALAFSIKYKRQMEFKRLSEMLRSHYTLLKNSTQTPVPPGQLPYTTPESLQLVLETRFSQTNTAIALDLWSEAFKTIEEIHEMLSAKSKPMTKPQMIAQYYLKLSQIYWVSKHHFFHAYAYSKFFHLSRLYNKSLSEEDLKQMSSVLMCAALSVPPAARDARHATGKLSGSSIDTPAADESEDEFEFDVLRVKKNRLASLLSFNNTVVNIDRTELLEELQSKGVTHSLVAPLADLYTLVEKHFHPLQYCGALQPKLEFIAAQNALKQYAEPLKSVIVLHLLDQTSQVYDNLKFSELVKMVPFLNKHQLEKLIVSFVAKKMVELKIDHQHDTIIFKSNNLESFEFRHKLNEVALGVHKAISMILPLYKPAHLAKEEQTAADRKKNFFQTVMKNLEEERNQILARRKKIEDKKILAESIATQKQLEEEETKRKLEEAREKEAEIKRKQAEEEREKARLEREEAELKRKRQQKFIENLAKKGFDSSVISKLEEGAIDPEEFLKNKIEEHEKERMELEKRIKRTAKELDWLERAKRIEEKPALQEWIQTFLKTDEALIKKKHEETKKAAKEKFQADMEQKKRFSRMLKAKAEFDSIVMKERSQAFEKLAKEREERIKVKKAQIAEQILAQQKEEEENRKKRELEDQKRQEELDRKKREDEEKIRKLRETEEKQRKKIQEVEEKLKKQDDKKPEEKPKGGYVPPYKRDSASKATDKPSTPEKPTSSTSTGKYVPPSKRNQMPTSSSETKESTPTKPSSESQEVKKEEEQKEPVKKDSWLSRRESFKKDTSSSESSQREREDKVESSKPSSSGPWKPSSSSSSARKNDEEKEAEDDGFSYVGRTKKK